MKNLIIITIFTCFIYSLKAQKLFSVNHQGVSSFFQTLPEAYAASVDGDTIYIPGGTFGGLSMFKSLALIGVGHDPDSTPATGYSELAYLEIGYNAHNSLITGLKFTNNFSVYGNNNNNVKISRCFVPNGITFSANSSFWTISESYLGNSYNYGYTLNNFILTNNVIVYWGTQLNQSEISHNIFPSGNSGFSANQSLIKSNVFDPVSGIQCDNCHWVNNLNNGVNGLNGTNGNTGSGNYLDDIPLESVFADFNTNNSFYQNDYHIVNTNYVDIDNSPIGLYGGFYPWKEGSLPFNPHIQSKIVAPTVNAQGNLNVQVQAAAQGN